MITVENMTNCMSTPTVASLSHALTTPVVSVPSTPMWREQSVVPVMGSGLGFAATGLSTINHNSIAAKAGVPAGAMDRRYADKQAAPPRGELR